MGDKHRVGLRDRNELWKRVAAKHGWRREVVLATKSKEFAFKYEIELIATLRTYHYDNEDGWGCNFTRGGDGSNGGYRHTQKYFAKHTGINHPMYGQSNQKLAALNLQWKGPTHPRYGKKHSAETCVKISQANRIALTGKKQSAATVMKRSGERNVRALLTWSDVHEIRRLRAIGETCAALAEHFNVKWQVIYKIVTFKTWRVNQ